jgi:hypothetical protein
LGLSKQETLTTDSLFWGISSMKNKRGGGGTVAIRLELATLREIAA